MIRFVPGLIGAVSALIVSKLVALLANVPLEIAAFLIAYIVATYAVDASMRRYGKRQA